MNNKIIATNGVLNIVKIIYELDDFIQLDDGTQHVIYYEESTPYFKINDTKYYLDEFIKTNYPD